MTTDDRALGEPLRLGNIEFWDRSSDGRDRSARAGRSKNGPAERGDPDVHSGRIMGGDETAAGSSEEVGPPPVIDRSHVPPGVLEGMRKQLADFADFAHRSRIAPNNGDALLALGCGGGITGAVVEHIASEVFKEKAVPALGADQRTQNDSLLLSLVSPEGPEKLTDRQRESFVSWRGRLALDVSMAEIGPEPEIMVVRLHDHPERQLPAGSEQVSKPSEKDPTSPCAALIVGSAAYIAGERPYLSLDALMTYARSKVYRSEGPSEGSPTQSAGLQAARNLEIVVLLDIEWLDGGLWIDVDRANGSAVAALAIGLSPEGARFTHIPKLRVPKLRTRPEEIATA